MPLSNPWVTPAPLRNVGLVQLNSFFFFFFSLNLCWKNANIKYSSFWHSKEKVIVRWERSFVNNGKQNLTHMLRVTHPFFSLICDPPWAKQKEVANLQRSAVTLTRARRKRPNPRFLLTPNTLWKLRALQIKNKQAEGESFTQFQGSVW